MTQGSPGRLFVSDLDGTLLGANAQLSDHSRRELTRLLHAGLPFTVASARSVVAMNLILGDLPITLPVINFMGAFISDFGTARRCVCHSIPKGITRRVMAEAAERTMAPFLSTYDGSRDHLYYSHLSNYGMEWYERDRREAGDPRLQQVGDLAAHLGEETICLTFIDRREHLAALRAWIETEIADSVQLAAWDHEYSEWHWLMVLDERATKAHALRTLARQLGVSLRDVTVFGDNVNDLPMFEVAGRAVAVANAGDEVKRRADEVIGSNQTDSVVAYLRRAWEGESLTA